MAVKRLVLLNFFKSHFRRLKWFFRVRICVNAMTENMVWHFSNDEAGSGYDTKFVLFGIINSGRFGRVE